MKYAPNFYLEIQFADLQYEFCEEFICYQVIGDKCVANILALGHLIDMNLFDTGLEVADIARCATG